jgi:hypothetical protein
MKITAKQKAYQQVFGWAKEGDGLAAAGTKKPADNGLLYLSVLDIQQVLLHRCSQGNSFADYAF